MGKKDNDDGDDQGSGAENPSIQVDRHGRIVIADPGLMQHILDLIRRARVLGLPGGIGDQFLDLTCPPNKDCPPITNKNCACPNAMCACFDKAALRDGDPMQGVVNPPPGDLRQLKETLGQALNVLERMGDASSRAERAP